MAAKPTDTPNWNTDASNRTEPNAGQQTTGWTAGQVPPSSYFNWWMNLVYQFCAYLYDGDLEGPITIDADGDVPLTITVANEQFALVISHAAGGTGTACISAVNGGEGNGVIGQSSSTDQYEAGVVGQSNASGGNGVAGFANGTGKGVLGYNDSGDGVGGESAGAGAGVRGTGAGTGPGVQGQGGTAGSGGIFTGGTGGHGVEGVAAGNSVNAGRFNMTSGTGTALRAVARTGMALELLGDSTTQNVANVVGLINMSGQGDLSGSATVSEQLTKELIPKAYCVFTLNDSGLPTIGDRMNISAIGQDVAGSDGLITITFAGDFADGNYVVSAICENVPLREPIIITKVAGSISFYSNDITGGAATQQNSTQSDTERWSLIFMGRQ